MAIIQLGDTKVNLFEDKKDDGWEYGYVEVSDECALEDKHVEIRRKVDSGIYDEVFMKYNNEWVSLTKHGLDRKKMPDDMLTAFIAIPSAVSAALHKADNYKTRNANQQWASSGKAKVTVHKNTDIGEQLR